MFLTEYQIYGRLPSEAGWSVRPSVPASPVGEDNPAQTSLRRRMLAGENRALGSQPAFFFYLPFNKIIELTVFSVVLLKDRVGDGIGQF